MISFHPTHTVRFSFSLYSFTATGSKHRNGGVATINDDHLNTHFLQSGTVRGTDIAVGDNHIDLVHTTNLRKTTASKLRRVGKDYVLLCHTHHHLIEMGLAEIGRSDAILQVDAIDTNKEFAKSTASKRLLAIGAYYRETAMTQSATSWMTSISELAAKASETLMDDVTAVNLGLC